MNTIWNDNLENKNINKLDKDINVDVLIIGGGITGMSIAYHLINSKRRVCVVERREVGGGITGRTTGKLSYLQGLIYQKISLYNDKDSAINYLKSQKDAIDIVSRIVKDNKIECDLTKVSSYTYTKERKNINKIKKEYKFLSHENIDVFIGDKLDLDVDSVKYISVFDTYVFHPLKYLYGIKDICLKNGIDIYENTKIIKVSRNGSGYKCLTDNNVILARDVVFACHYPYFTIPFLMPLKGYLEKSYIMVTKMKDNLKISGITDDEDNFSFRSHSDSNNNYLICLGKSHNLCNLNCVSSKFKELETSSLLNDIKYAWTNHDIITSDYLPFIGILNKHKHLYIATGYNKWGMTNGSIAGKVISDLILGKDNEYVELFNPNRDINLGKLINTPKNIYSSIKGIIKTKLKSSCGNTIYKRENGEKIAIYNEYKIKNRCPHLGCGLIFNDKEKTWDCPCHGSRFEIGGRCINGPSNDDIKNNNCK